MCPGGRDRLRVVARIGVGGGGIEPVIMLLAVSV